MTFCERIKNRRKSLSLSQEKLAQMVGYECRSAINKIELGKVNVPQNRIGQFARALQTSEAYLMGWIDDPELTHEDTLNMKLDMTTSKNDSMINIIKLPILGKVACGEPIYAPETADTYVISNSNLKADFALIADGDSMIGEGIYDGDIVLIKSQPEVENGEIAAVAINNEHTLKKVFYYKDQNKLILNPANKEYEPMFFSGEELDEIKILGKAVAVQHILN